MERQVPASTGTFYGQPMTAGDIYTIAGGGNGGPGVAGVGFQQVAGVVQGHSRGGIDLGGAARPAVPGEPEGAVAFSGDGGRATSALGYADVRGS